MSKIPVHPENKPQLLKHNCLWLQLHVTKMHKHIAVLILHPIKNKKTSNPGEAAQAMITTLSMFTKISALCHASLQSKVPTNKPILIMIQPAPIVSAIKNQVEVLTI